MIRRLLVVAVAAAALAPWVAAPLGAQKGPPKRPALAAGADTNLAHAYYDRGLEVLEQMPSAAADAFYWAARLDPMWAEAYYARRVALLLSDSRRLGRYMRGERGALRSAAGQRADSLQLRALALNPFLYQKLDRYLLSAVVRGLAEEATGGSSADAMLLEFEVERYLKESVEMRAWYAYSYGQFPQALEHYAAAIARTREKARLRAQRGRLFFQLGQADSALAELTRALAEMRKGDQKELVHLYESKALMEHSIGLVHQRLGAADSARAAFGRALEEDLAFHPAHVQLGLMALQAQDTATALGELDLAVQLNGGDASLRLFYGYTLGSLGRYADAEVQLRKAAELEPVWAVPHHVLAEVLEAQRRNADALAEYRRFLALASRQDPRVADVNDRVVALASTSAAP